VRQVPSCGGQQRSIGRSQLGTRDLPGPNLELVAKNEQLDVFTLRPRRLRTSAPQQRANGEVEDAHPPFDSAQTRGGLRVVSVVELVSADERRWGGK